MRLICGFFLLLIGGLLIAITVDNSIIINCILKVLGALCFVGFIKISQKDKNTNLY
jgi:hypothetical protein